MDISIFLAKFWGWFFLLFFVLFIIYPKRIKQMFAFAKDDKFMIILSILGIIIGLLHILAHNLWVKDWRVIITLFGWFSLSKGISQFAFQLRHSKVICSVVSNSNISITNYTHFGTNTG